MNILFVDDEPNILSGLQRMLRPLRHEWTMSFANSGAEALAMLETEPVEVIVSDMKMPGMDGSQLLQKVTERYPHVIRIILSGYSEKEMIIKSVGTAHQYLSKPCDPETLKATVDRVAGLRSLVTNESLRLLVSRLPNVPSLPTLYTDLMDELGRPEPSTRIIGEIVMKDLGMTAKLLQIVNSAFFGLRRQISDSREAVEFLGMETISSLTLAVGVISQIDGKAASRSIEELWSHSMSVGAMAQQIAALENRESKRDAFTAGLLHDLGKAVLISNLPGDYQRAEELAETDGITLADAERQICGATHSEVGAFLIGLWGLPTEVVEAVAFHHEPHVSDCQGFTALTAVHAADAIHHFTSGRDRSRAEPVWDQEYLSRIGLRDRSIKWLEKCAPAVPA